MQTFRTHYDNLKVARDAPIEVIRAAYRALAQRYHPDVSPAPDAARVMKLLNEAWRVLGDPKLRAEHDEWIAQQLVEEAIQEALQGVEARRARPNSGASNAATSAKHKSHDLGVQERHADAQAKARRPANPLARLSTWLGTSEGKTYAAGAAIATAVIVGLWPRMADLFRSSPASAETSSQARSSLPPVEAFSQPPSFAPEDVPTRSTASKESSKPSPTASRAPQSPRWSPNSKPWPAVAGYLTGMPRRATGGLSRITVDNTSGGSDVYVKLCKFGLEKCEGLRHVFIPQGSTFTMSGVAAAIYEIRYRNLDSGYAAKSDSMPLRQVEDEQGTRYSAVKLTLYTVPGGNTNFTPLAEDAF